MPRGRIRSTKSLALQDAQNHQAKCVTRLKAIRVLITGNYLSTEENTRLVRRLLEDATEDYIRNDCYELLEKFESDRAAADKAAADKAAAEKAAGQERPDQAVQEVPEPTEANLDKLPEALRELVDWRHTLSATESKVAAKPEAPVSVQKMDDAEKLEQPKKPTPPAPNIFQESPKVLRAASADDRPQYFAIFGLPEKITASILHRLCRRAVSRRLGEVERIIGGSGIAAGV